MGKQLFLVFQDCYKCGTQEHWAWLQEQYAKEAGYELVPMAFYKAGADALIKTASKKGYNLPFVTDTNYFAYGVKGVLEQITEAEKKAMAKKAKKTTKRKTKKATEKSEAEPDYIEVGDGIVE